MDKREVYVWIKTIKSKMWFSFVTNKTLEEVKEFYSTYGILIVCWMEWKKMWKALSWMTWIFVWAPMDKIIRNYKYCEVRAFDDIVEAKADPMFHSAFDDMQNDKLDADFEKLVDWLKL